MNASAGNQPPPNPVADDAGMPLEENITVPETEENSPDEEDVVPPVIVESSEEEPVIEVVEPN